MEDSLECLHRQSDLANHHLKGFRRLPWCQIQQIVAPRPQFDRKLRLYPRDCDCLSDVAKVEIIRTWMGDRELFLLARATWSLKRPYEGSETVSQDIDRKKWQMLTKIFHSNAGSEIEPRCHKYFVACYGTRYFRFPVTAILCALNRTRRSVRAFLKLSPLLAVPTAHHSRYSCPAL